MMLKTAIGDEQKQNASDVCEKAFVFIMNNRHNLTAVPNEADYNKEQATAVKTFVTIVRGLIDTQHSKALKRREEAAAQQYNQKSITSPPPAPTAVRPPMAGPSAAAAQAHPQPPQRPPVSQSPANVPTAATTPVPPTTPRPPPTPTAAQ